LDIRQVAARLSIPSGTVKRRLHDAREKLRERLKSQLPL
jgi:DNA-directed RNA polymerase specialized sigma24 family protein